MDPTAVVTNTSSLYDQYHINEAFVKLKKLILKFFHVNLFNAACDVAVFGLELFALKR